MITYLFHELGSIPGIPGSFAHVRVDINDDGTFVVKPLHTVRKAETVPGVVLQEEAQVPQDMKASKAIVTSQIVPEQAARLVPPTRVEQTTSAPTLPTYGG